MLRSIKFIPFCLCFIVVIAIVVCKYFYMPGIFLLVIIITSILYQIDFNKKKNKMSNFEETLINLSRFIIISGIFGYVVVRIVGLFVNKFD
jgi:hypothetical protein